VIYLRYVGAGMLLQMGLVAINPPFLWWYLLIVAAVGIGPPLVIQRLLINRNVTLSHERDSKSRHDEQENIDNTGVR